MQVKKFEAPTMKEALEMVKNQLGPEAIILNAKDNSKGFGLLGRQSIEITAAITEKQLHHKQWAESRLREDELASLKNKTAKGQKQFIDRSVNRYLQAQAPMQSQRETESYGTMQNQTSSNQRIDPRDSRRQPTQQRYIDIDNTIANAEYAQNQAAANVQNSNNLQTLRGAKGKTVNDVLREIGQSKSFVEGTSSEQRVKSAVKNALVAFEETQTIVPLTPRSPNRLMENKNPVGNQVTMNEVQVLKNEILELKNILHGLSSNKNSGMQIFESSIPLELSHIQQKLINSGIDRQYVDEMLQQAQRDLNPEMAKKSSFVEGYIAKRMLSEINIKEVSQGCQVQVFMGPTGSGKSSHLVKLASHYVIQQNKKVGILTLDTEKVGAVEQLRIYSQILNVPFGIIRKPEDWKSVQDATKNLDYVLIDFPANSLKELTDIEKFRRMLPPESLICDKHLVVSATFKDSDVVEIAERYRLAKPTDLIINKLDEAVTHGLIYNLQRKLDLPLYAFGVGQNLPEDFEFATRERVIDLVFKITKFKNQKLGVG